MADGAVLAGDVLVREYHVQLRAVLLVLVRTAGEVHHLVAFDAAGARIHGIRTDRGQVVEIEGQDLAGFRNSHSYFCPVFPCVGRSGKTPAGRRRTSPACAGSPTSPRSPSRR